MTKFLNISTDNTLGGNSPSDETVSSQKAIKTYVDNHGSWTPPSQTGNAGKFLTTDGSDTSWGTALVNNATGTGSFSLVTAASYNYSYFISNGSSNSNYSTAFGHNASAAGGGSCVFGASSFSNSTSGVMIGYSVEGRAKYGVAIGAYSKAGSSTSYSYSTALGAYAIANRANCIQIGKGTNTTSDSFFVGSVYGSGTNYQLMDLKTGNIPIARLGATSSDTDKFLKGDGTWAEVGGGVSTDGISITTNSSDEIQTIGVIDQNNTTNAIKTWTGTKAQYDAIATKDANTVYNITDDANPLQALLETIYPVGSIYIGTMNICPLSALFGTWQLVGTKILIDIPTTLEAKGNGKTIGFTDLTNEFGLQTWNDQWKLSGTTASSGTNAGSYITTTAGIPPLYTTLGISTDTSKSGIIADTNATALTVNIWQRTA